MERPIPFSPPGGTRVYVPGKRGREGIHEEMRASSPHQKKIDRDCRRKKRKEETPLSEKKELIHEKYTKCPA